MKPFSRIVCIVKGHNWSRLGKQGLMKRGLIVNISDKYCARSLTDLAALSLIALFSLVGAVDLGEAERTTMQAYVMEHATVVMSAGADGFSRVVRIPITEQECQ